MDNIELKNSYIINKNLIKRIGTLGAIVIGYLAFEYKQAKQYNLLESEEYFCVSIDKMKEDLTLGKKAQNTILNKLEERGLLSKKLIGLPAKRYFRINPNVLEQLVFNN